MTNGYKAIYTLLFPNEMYIPVECINSDRSLKYLDTSVYDTSDYEYTSIGSIRDIRTKIVENPSLHKTGFIFSPPRGPNIYVKDTLTLDTNRRIAAFAVVKTEEFKNGVDYTNPTNWYYALNYSTLLSTAVLKDIRMGFNISSKKTMFVDGRLKDLSFEFFPTLSDTLPDTKKDILRQFFEATNEVGISPSPMYEFHCWCAKNLIG